MQQKISSAVDCSSLKVAYEKMEIDVNALKQNIANSEQRYSVLTERITSNSISIQKIQGTVASHQTKLSFLNQVNISLDSAVKQVKEATNYRFYNCNGATDVVVDNTHNDGTCFKFGSQSWAAYLSQVYGISIQ